MTVGCCACFLKICSATRGKVGGRIAVASDGEQALDYLFAKGKYAGRDPNDLPYLILLDLKLPKVDRLEVLRQVRAKRRSQFVPIVIPTSSDEESDLCAAYRSGVNSYVRKPVDFQEFMEAVRELGLFWLVRNKLPPMAKF